MKWLIYFFLITYNTLATAQYQLAFIKTGLESVNVYDTTTGVILETIHKSSYFHFDKVMPNGKYIYTGYGGGYCYKDSIQIFSELPQKVQNKIINEVFNKFYSICTLDRLPIIDTFGGEIDTTYILPWEKYYNDTFNPILGQFDDYYKITNDTISLFNLMQAVKCDPDGEFGETLSIVLASCYLSNKGLFIRQFRKLKNKEYRGLIKTRVYWGIGLFYTHKERWKTINNPGLIEKEEAMLDKLLK